MFGATSANFSERLFAVNKLVTVCLGTPYGDFLAQLG